MIAARMRMVCFLTGSVMLLAGCQQQPGALTHVSGIVTFKGVPLHDGLIVFTPDADRGASGKIACGKIQPDGSYVLQTDDAPGAAAGLYRVTVASLFGTSTSIDVPPQSMIPERYRDPQLSQVQYEVKPNRDNRVNFNLID